MKDVIIFGDSYSTFNGYIPEGFATYYPLLDVNSVEETWWNRLREKTDFCLVQNNSWSGSTICHTGYGNSDCSKTSSFICRYRKLKKILGFPSSYLDTRDKRKSVLARGRIFVCIIHYSIFIIHYSFNVNGFSNE